MSNTHGQPDVLHELMAWGGDLLPAAILSTTWPVVPASSLTLAAFATYGYAISGRTLVYIDQPAVPVTLPSAAGTYWLALHRDTSSAVSGWTRRVGSHYLFQASASQPAAPEGAVLLSSVTVAGAVITAVSQTGIRRAPMSRQDAGAVAITGGHATGLTTVGVGTPNPLTPLDVVGNTNLRGSLAVNTNTLVVNHLTGMVGINQASPASALHVVGNTTLTVSLVVDNTTLVVDGTLHTVGLRRAPRGNITLDILWPKAAGTAGIYLQQAANDAAADPAVIFANVAGSTVGSITTTGSATAYNTASDRRLKEAIETLTGGLATLTALTPVRFRWRADGSPGVGFAAQDVQPLVPEAVTGDAEAASPMQMDLSKLVPYLVASVQELAAQVQTLTARLAALEA